MGTKKKTTTTEFAPRPRPKMTAAKKRPAKRKVPKRKPGRRVIAAREFEDLPAWVTALDSNELDQWIPLGALTRETVRPDTPTRLARALALEFRELKLIYPNIGTVPRPARRVAAKQKPLKRPKRKAAKRKSRPPEPAPPPPPAIWKNLAREFRVLICTKHKKYAKLRKELSLRSNESTVVLVALVAAALAGALGTAAGVIVPLVALLLRALLMIGKEALCKSLADW